MHKYGVLVTGPESSGTKLVTRLLIDSGYSGSYFDEQPFDDYFNNEQLLPYMNCVFRRSIPHAQVNPDYQKIKYWINQSNLHLKTIITVRNYIPCLKSKIKRKHNTDDVTDEVLMDQFIYLGKWLEHLKPFLIINTSYLTTNSERTLIEIEQFLHTEIIRPFYIYDMDNTHYQRS